MKLIEGSTLVAMLMTASTVAAQALAPVSPPASTTGISVNEVGLFASGVTAFDPAPRNEPFDTTTVNDPNSSIGAPDGGLVSLGDLTSEEIASGFSPGEITVEFPGRAFNGPGADIVVFENANDFAPTFTDPFTFAELAFVEVSTNGVDFARFPSISLNIEQDDATNPDAPNEIQPAFGRTFAGINTTFVSNLAGVHGPVAGDFFGTGFDLEDLVADPLVTAGAVDLEDIRFVRIVDIPGTGEFLDSLGNPILDTAVSTEFPQGQGFDLDAVGAINFVPEPSSLAIAAFGFGLFARGRRRG